MEALSTSEVILGSLYQFRWVWASLFVIMSFSFVFRRRLGLYGRVYDTGIGVVGIFLVFFWVSTAVLADTIALFDPLAQFPEMRHALPGEVHAATEQPFLFGGDKLGRDVFSRMIYGAQIVLTIAPGATLLAFIVGMFLGLPAGYFSGWLDSFLSFLANLLLAFPVILLFYLLVKPGIREETPVDFGLFEIGMSIPKAAAIIFALLSVGFFTVLIFSKYRLRVDLLVPFMAIVGVAAFWLTSGLVFGNDPITWAGFEPWLRLDPAQLNIFVAVVFASSPGVFRIVRGLTLDIATRDYVAAARTRGEGPWYTMLWEILPNARGPLIVDACLRIGYTTILLGTLGYFGLGLSPESPDWGTTIKEGSQLLRRYVHPLIPPALALVTFVLGLNLLADSLREQSLKD